MPDLVAGRMVLAHLQWPSDSDTAERIHNLQKVVVGSCSDQAVERRIVDLAELHLGFDTADRLLDVLAAALGNGKDLTLSSCRNWNARSRSGFAQRWRSMSSS